MRLRAELEAASSLIDLARRLGAVVLEDGARAMRLLHEPRTTASREAIEQTIQSLDLSAVHPRQPRGFLHLLEHHGLGDLVDLVATDDPLAHLALLRGLCQKPLTVYFEQTEAVITLDRGMPVPFPERPVKSLAGEATPHNSTTTRSGLLEGLGYALFEHRANEPIQVELDFRFRDRLDEATWSHAGRLPRVATLHPSLTDAELEIEEIEDASFFGVRPARWDATDVLDRLEAVADVEIAVLPELSLPRPDELEAALAENPESYPRLIVAGSAHVRRRTEDGSEVRANEARIYLDGSLVGSHHKVHPFATKKLNGLRREREWVEGLTAEQKVITVLSSRHTRLAVAICADCNDENARVPSLLEAACVNLLLVPSLTDGAGAFTAALSGIASRCQGVGVIVNGDRGLSPDPGPFLAMVGVPRPLPGDQLRAYPAAPGDPRGTLGVFDPNATLSQAMEWRRSD